MSPRSFLAVSITLIVTTCTAIAFNIPTIRPVLGLMCFSVLPGFLVLRIFRQGRIDFAKSVLLAVGLSIFLLMFGGLSINWIYPLFGYGTPLSTVSIVISFSVILVILSVVAYLRDREVTHLVPYSVSSTRVGRRRDNLSPTVIFPLFFPLLSILGTYFMEATGNNILLIITLGLIPVYVVSIILLRKWIPTATYPVAIGAISVALLLMNGLPSSYSLGDDVHSEYLAFTTTLSNQYWSISEYAHLTNATLSTSLLPAVYERILGINTFYIYKVVYNLIFSLIPLAVYSLCKERFREPDAFLASLFFTAQITFLYTLQSAMREGIALLFFALAMMALFDREIQPLGKKALFLAFLIGTVVSHYTTAYICFFLLLATWLATMVLKTKQQSEDTGGVSGTGVAIISILIFLWYSQLTTGFATSVGFIESTFRKLGEFAVLESRGGEVMVMIGTEAKETLTTVWVVINWITIAFIGIGILSLAVDYVRRKKAAIEPGLFIVMCSSLLLVSVTIILPYVATYNPSRVYIQMLVLLAPAFVIGNRAIARLIGAPQVSLLLMTVVVLAQFLATTYIAPKTFDVVSVALTRESYAYDKYYIHDQEVLAIQWLDEHSFEDSKVYCDEAVGHRFSESFTRKLNPDSTFFQGVAEPRDDGYIYLTEANVVRGRVYPTPGSTEAADISQYYHLLAPRSKIYSNGSSEIWK